MMNNIATRRRPPDCFPDIPGFDLNEGPEGLDDPVRVGRSRRLGSSRWAAPDEDLPDYLQEEKLDREYLRDLSFSGLFGARSGEDLPRLRPRQVQLAGFCYTQTVHCECWSFRAFRGVSRIRYSFADETDLDGNYPVELALKTTLEWPSLGKLIWMLDHGDFFSDFPGIYFPTLIWPVWEGGEAPEEMTGYVKVHSEFYPALQDWYEQATLFWEDDVRTGVSDWKIVDSIELMARHLSP